MRKENEDMIRDRKNELQRKISSIQDINFQDENGNTVLILAATYGYTDLVEDILNKQPKPDLNIKNKLGETALARAILLGHAKIAKILINAGADVNIEDNDGNTPILLAALTRKLNREEKIELIKRLKEKEANKIKNRFGCDISEFKEYEVALKSHVVGEIFAPLKGKSSGNHGTIKL